MCVDIGGVILHDEFTSWPSGVLQPNDIYYRSSLQLCNAMLYIRCNAATHGYYLLPTGYQEMIKTDKGHLQHYYSLIHSCRFSKQHCKHLTLDKHTPDDGENINVAHFVNNGIQQVLVKSSVLQHCKKPACPASSI